jgi:hypothetical protein
VNDSILFDYLEAEGRCMSGAARKAKMIDVAGIMSR